MILYTAFRTKYTSIRSPGSSPDDPASVLWSIRFVPIAILEAPTPEAALVQAAKLGSIPPVISRAPSNAQKGPLQ